MVGNGDTVVVAEAEKAAMEAEKEEMRRIPKERGSKRSSWPQEGPSTRFLQTSQLEHVQESCNRKSWRGSSDSKTACSDRS